MELVNQFMRRGMHRVDVRVAEVDDQRVFLVLRAVFALPAAFGFLNRVAAEILHEDGLGAFLRLLVGVYGLVRVLVVRAEVEHEFLVARRSFGRCGGKRCACLRRTGGAGCARGAAVLRSASCERHSRQGCGQRASENCLPYLHSALSFLFQSNLSTVYRSCGAVTPRYQM